MSDPFYYHRHLPHYQPPESNFFITMRLAGSLPQEVIIALKKRYIEMEKTCENLPESEKNEKLDLLRKKYFGEFDHLLDSATTGPQWLRDPEIMAVIKEALHHRDQRVYHLLAYSIMPNHVHLVFDIKSDSIVGRRGSSTVGISQMSTRLVDLHYGICKYDAQLLRRGDARL